MRGEKVVETTACRAPPRPRVFIAEDSILISLDLEAILCAMGCEVVGVGTNLAQALQFANPDKIDLSLAWRLGVTTQLHRLQTVK